MKKLFTLACALFGLTATMNAATVDDLKVCKHSYVLVCDDWTNNGTVRPGKGELFGDDFFLDVTGGSVATNKGSFDIAVADGDIITEELAAKYGEDYGGVKHYNCLRLKQKQDVIAMKVTKGSKLIFIYQHGGNAARYPLFATKADLSDAADIVQGTDHRPEDGDYKSYGRMEWTAPDDMLVYIGDNGGDMWVSFIIVEANEVAGTPTVKVGPQSYEGGLWFKEVTCKANDVDGIPTIVKYTTDGSDPTEDNGTEYTDAIKCYANTVVKFQAFMDLGGGLIWPIADADNEAAVNFMFDAPTINADGGNVSIVSPYDGAKNYYMIGTADAVEGSEFTLEESASITAYSQIVNGTYATFTTNSVFKDVYVLNPIKEKKTVQVTAGDVVVDEEATAGATDGSTIYKVENGEISADKKDFFVKNLEFAVVKDEKYQIEGEERYIKMNNTNITFEVAEGDSVDVKVICSKNSCKNIDSETETDRQCYVNVSGTNYGNADVTAENGNVIEFRLGNGTWTFQKYSGTGNIMIYSIEITPASEVADGISNTVVNENASKTVKVLKDGRLVIKKGDVEFNVSGVQVK